MTPRVLSTGVFCLLLIGSACGGDSGDDDDDDVVTPDAGAECATAADCDDGVDCTDDACDPDGVCTHAPNDATCDDGMFCNGVETCDATADCQAGTAPTEDDGVGCTDDVCNEATDDFDHTANDASCDNGAFCDGAEICDVTLDCQAGVAPVIDDGVACTDDSCDETLDVVVNAANDANCDDTLFCNGVETCDATADCQAGALVIDDMVTCTVDACDESTDTVTHTPNNALCDDTLFCNGAETCDLMLDCQAGTPPPLGDGVTCTVDACVEATDTITHTPSNALCDDTLFCNGAETCNPTLDCQPGTSPPLDDGVTCTVDACNESTDTVTHTPNDAACDDGAACTTNVCDPSFDCQFLPDDSLCDDTVFCNGVETCQAFAGCQPATAPAADDGVDCTVDACDESTDTITNTPDDSFCEDGSACTDNLCDPSVVSSGTGCVVTPSALVTSPVEGFESGGPGWTHGALSGSVDGWALSTTSGGTAPVSFGTTMYGTPNQGDQLGFEDSFLRSPVFDMTGGGLIFFDSFVSNEDGTFDLEMVEVSYDGGTVFSTLIPASDPRWTIQRTTLPMSAVIPAADGTATTVFRFHYNTIDGCCGPSDVVGWYVDNFVATTCDVPALPDCSSVLVFNDCVGSAPCPASLADATAADEASTFYGLPVMVTSDNAAFQTAIASGTHDLVFFESNLTCVPQATIDAVTAYVTGGGRLAFSFWNLDGGSCGTNVAALKTALAVATVGDFFAPKPVFNDPTSLVNLFGLFESFPSPLNFTNVFNDDGDDLMLTGAGFLAARFTSDVGPGAISVTNSERTVVNSFDPFGLLVGTPVNGDADGLRDLEELYRNEMLMMCTP